MESTTQPQTYVLIAPERLETLVRNHFMLSQSVLLFEYLLSQSNFPLFLSANSACEVLNIKPETLEQCRRKRIIRPRIYQRQFLYSAYDLIALSVKLNQKHIRRMLHKLTRVAVK